MRKHVLTATALGALMLSPAMAQNTIPPASNNPPANQAASQATSSGSFIQEQMSNEWRSSRLVGTRVLGPDNKSIGNITDLILDQNGNVQAVVIGVGGFLGIGEKDVAIPFKNMTVQRTSDGNSIDHVSVTYTRDQLHSAPAFKFMKSRS